MDRRSLLRCLAALPFVPAALAKPSPPELPYGWTEAIDARPLPSAWDTDAYSANYDSAKIRFHTDFFGWSPDADGIARIIERGECVGEFGPWTPATVFTVDLDTNGTLSYSKDGVICRHVAPEAFGELSGVESFFRQSRVDGREISFAR